MKVFVLTMIVMMTAGCSAVDMKMYADNTPRLDLIDYFTGNTKGWGIVQDRKGALRRQFVVDIDGEVTEKGELVLREEFSWNDGERSSRTWVIRQEDEHSLFGTAEDVPEEASGIVYGNVLNWKYKLNLKVDDSTWKITFDDWLFKVDEEMLINRATMTKFGITVGEVTIIFRKEQNPR